MSDLNFTCPECGGHSLQLVERACIHVTEVIGIEDGVLQLGESICTAVGDRNQYDCADCETVIAENTEDLLEILAKMPPVEEEDSE